MIPNPFQRRSLLYIGLAIYIVGLAWITLTLRSYLKELPAVEMLGDYKPSLVTRILDVRQELVSELFVERRTVLALPQIPQDFQRAVLATEDTDFYNHWGIHPKGIMRAMLANLKAGRAVQGGSTITQQLAKNIFLTQRRTLDRKIKEMLLTLQIERNFSKDEILQLYFNQIYFGHGAYGVDSAARIFFGKKVGDLTLPECALLAGLPKAPSAYSPFNRPRQAVRRRALVLNRMKEENFINEKEYYAALGAPLGILKDPQSSNLAAYFVEHVRRELEARYGPALYRDGLTIYTTLDLRMQRAAEDTMAKNLNAVDKTLADGRMQWLVKNKKLKPEEYAAWKKAQEKPEEGEEAADATPEAPPDENAEPIAVQGALVAIDPQTGGVRALVGGRDFQKSKFNRATQAKRQPGSTFKPFVWLAALESGMTAATVMRDEPLAFTDVETHPKLVAEATDYVALGEMVTHYYQIPREKDAPDPIWAPRNWDNKYLGPITLRKALALSRNLVSIRLVDRVGPKTVVNYAKRAGIESPLDAVLSLGLGVSVVTPLELVSAFSTFDNNGVHMRPYSILRVVDKEGKVLEENVPQGQTALSSQANYLITRLLQAVTKEGTGRGALRTGRAVAGKTGTTQDQRDLWFVGFTPGLVAGCWIGYDDFVPIVKTVSSAGNVVPWWTDFMIQAQKYVPSRDFDVPPGIVFAKIDADTGLLSVSCPHETLEAFRQNAVPQEFCNVDHEGLIKPVSEDIEEITE